MTRERAKYVLDRISEQVVEQSLHIIGNGGRPVMALVVGGPDGGEITSFIQILDLRDRVRILADAVAQRQADLCVFAYDGWIDDPLSRAVVSRRDALLVIAASRWRADSRAFAVPYEFHENKGARRGKTIESPEIVDEYAPVFGSRWES